MADFDTAEFRASRFTRSRADEIANRTFPVAMRGYDRAAVDAFLQEVVQVITDLESRQTQDTVVQRAKLHGLYLTLTLYKFAFSRGGRPQIEVATPALPARTKTRRPARQHRSRGIRKGC